MEHRQPKRVAEKGAKKVYGRSSGNKAQITVVVCASATGVVLPPMVIFQGAHLNHELTLGEVPGTLYGLSENGWIDQTLFFSWFTEIFIRNIPPARPVLLLLDGHSTHYTPEVTRAAAKEGVVMLCLPPHTTHAIQPLDVSFFKSLKVHWSAACHQYMVDNPGRVVTKFQFSSLFREAWFKSIKPETVVAGFRKAGVYPLNPNAISVPALDASSLTSDSSLMDSFTTPYDHASLAPSNQSPDAGLPATNPSFYRNPSPNPTSFDTPTSNSQVSCGLKDPLTHISPIVNPCESPSTSQSSLSKYTIEQLLLYERRYENGYNIFTDDSYVEWLLENHPDALPEHTLPEPVNAEEPQQDSTPIQHSTPIRHVDNSLLCQNVMKEPRSPTHAQPDTHTPITEFLTYPRCSMRSKSKVSLPSSGARVLTSAQSLALIEEKQKKKREEEAKQKRKEERAIRKAKQEEEKRRKAEERAKKAAERQKVGR